MVDEKLAIDESEKKNQILLDSRIGCGILVNPAGETAWLTGLDSKKQETSRTRNQSKNRGLWI